ncbi:tryptophan 2,3-dioxygenase family protein [Fibrella sp. WM1]|uniref:tryptophan 2,3-dioxygenase family protein n=1 Tax=Fibrella musci TaxID=3242485 RepID=UPI003521E5F1
MEQLLTQFSEADLRWRLDKLPYEREIVYADYIQLDALLHLQQPRSHYPDEVIFITYHQITELYFKLIIQEIKQLLALPATAGETFLDKVRRINRYCKNLIYSFDIVIDGLDRVQFEQFRKVLVPASGFQSLQFRQIELYSTSLMALTNGTVTAPATVEQLFASLYWKRGAIDTTTGQKDQCLVNFEQAYDQLLYRHALNCQGQNISTSFEKFYDQPEYPQIVAELRDYDQLFNVGWKTIHYKAALRHLMRNGNAAAATGGTNWRAYLPPRFQRISFFSSLWQQEEEAEWGKLYVEKYVTQAAA